MKKSSVAIVTTKIITFFFKRNKLFIVIIILLLFLFNLKFSSQHSCRSYYIPLKNFWQLHSRHKTFKKCLIVQQSLFNIIQIFGEAIERPKSQWSTTILLTLETTLTQQSNVFKVCESTKTFVKIEKFGKCLSANLFRMRSTIECKKLQPSEVKKVTA